MNKLKSLQKELFQILQPKTNISLLDYAKEFGKLSPENSAVTGRFKPYPYQEQILKDMSDPRVETLSWMKSTRVGYTRILALAVAYHIEIDPAPQVLFTPNNTKAREFAKKELAPMIRDMKLNRFIYNTRIDDNLLVKAYKGGFIDIRGANTANNLASVTAKDVYADEIDRFKSDLDNEGSALKMISNRNESYYDGTFFMGSTPTIKGHSLIEQQYFLGDMNRRFVMCLKCKTLQIIVFGNIIIPQTTRAGVKHWNTKDAYLRCINCDYKIPHSDLRKMDAEGVWRQTQKFYCCNEWQNPLKNKTWTDKGEAICKKCKKLAEYNLQDRIKRSYHIWAAYSQQPKSTWEHLANEFVEARDDKNKMKTFVNTWLGETFEDYKVTITSNKIMEKIEAYTTAPKDTKIILITVDVQKDRLEYLITAWLSGEVSYNLRNGVIQGDPSLSNNVWEELNKIFITPIETEDRRKVKIFKGFIDMAGGATEAVKRFVKKNTNWIMLKGDSNEVKEDDTRAVSYLKYTSDRDYLIMWVATNKAKDIVFERIEQNIIHHNLNFDEEWFEQITSEKKVLKQNKQGKLQYFYVKVRERNEALDLIVYQLAGIRLMQEYYKNLDLTIKV